MAEWSMVHAWKACVAEMSPGVRIPLSPPYNGEVACRSRSFCELCETKAEAQAKFLEKYRRPGENFSLKFEQTPLKIKADF